MLRKCENLKRLYDEDLERLGYTLTLEHISKGVTRKYFTNKDGILHPKMPDGFPMYEAIHCYADNTENNIYFVCYYDFKKEPKVDIYSEGRQVFPTGFSEVELLQDKAGFVYAIMKNENQEKSVYQEWANTEIVKCPKSYRISVKSGKYGYPYFLIGDHQKLVAYNKMGEIEAIGKNLKEINEILD